MKKMKKPNWKKQAENLLRKRNQVWRCDNDFVRDIKIALKFAYEQGKKDDEKLSKKLTVIIDKLTIKQAKTQRTKEVLEILEEYCNTWDCPHLYNELKQKIKQLDKERGE